jgi:hypothetical protein
MKYELSTFDIINGLGIERGRLREWMNERFIVPSIQKAEGVGTKALFDRIAIVALVLFKHLIDAHKMARKEASIIASLFSRTVHLFAEVAGDGCLEGYLHGSGQSEYEEGWKRLRIARKNGSFIVESLVAFDLYQYIHGEEPADSKFQESLGGEKAFQALMDESRAADTFMIGGNRSFDFVTVLNFRSIVSEARKVYET